MADQIKLSIIFLIKHNGKERKYAMGTLIPSCGDCNQDRPIMALFDAGMQTAIVEVNKLISKEASSE